MKVLFNKRIVTLETASTYAEQSKGLAGRNALLPDHGMLFSFPWDVRIPFTVKEMKFPIDILFLDKAFNVIWVFERAQPGDQRPFKPPVSFRYVMELPGGFFAQNRADRVLVSPYQSA